MKSSVKHSINEFIKTDFRPMLYQNKDIQSYMDLVLKKYFTEEDRNALDMENHPLTKIYGHLNRQPNAMFKNQLFFHIEDKTNQKYPGLEQVLYEIFIKSYERHVEIVKDFSQ
jgi:hypothetical protein